MADIEKVAIGKLFGTIARSKYLDPHLTLNDKTPSWDGFLFVYRDLLKNKEGLVGRIPVQAKGKQVPNCHTATTAYSFDVLDLKNYFNDGGVILFVVEVSATEEKIFYKCLWRSDIKDILGKAKRKVKKKPQGTVTINLAELDVPKLPVLENDCNNFLLNKEKQFSAINHSLQVEDASKLSIYFITDGSPIEDYLLSHEIPLYGSKNPGETEFFISKINIDAIGTQINCGVIIESQEYYPGYEFIKTKNGRIIKFGKNITINIDTQHLKFELLGTVEEQISDNVFLLKLFESRVVLFGESKLEITSLAKKDELVEQLTKNIKMLKEIQALFNLFRVRSKDLDFDAFDSSSYTNLGILVGKFIYNKTHEKVPFKEGFNAVRIGNITLGIFVYKEEDEKGYEICNLFNQMDKFYFQIKTDGGDFVPVSPYVFLKKEFLLLVDNLDLQVVFEDMQRIQMTGDYNNLVTLFGLELIKAYDDSHQAVFLETANRLFVWLQEKDENDFISKMNEYQVIKRQRNFTGEEKLALIHLREQFSGDYRLLCGISILLENKSDVEYYLNKLPDQVKKEFIEYPIYTMAGQLGII